MATWYDFIASIKTSFAANTTLAGIKLIVGRDEPYPQSKAIRVIRGDTTGEQRLRARNVGSAKTVEIIIEAWEESQSIDPMAGYAALEAVEEKIDNALADWADNPPGMDGVQFYPRITKRVSANESITRPMVGSQITISIDYV